MHATFLKLEFFAIFFLENFVRHIVTIKSRIFSYTHEEISRLDASQRLVLLGVTELNSCLLLYSNLYAVLDVSTFQLSVCFARNASEVASY